MTVVQEFPGTPWELMAQQELDTPHSYSWTESRRKTLAVNAAGGTVAVGVPRVPRDEEKNELPRPKPRRKVDKI